MLKKIKPALAFSALISMEVAWIQFRVAYAGNIFAFLSILYAILTWGCWMERKKKSVAPLLKSYRDGKHLPEWMDTILYGAMVLYAVAFGHWFYGVCWFLVYSVDVEFRELALKESQD